MFATNIIATVTNQIDNLSSQIQELERQLAALRENQKALETERQALQTLAGAGESAITQVRQFLAMAQSRPDMIEAFWDELSATTSHVIAELPPAADDNDDETTSDAPIDPAPMQEIIEEADLTGDCTGDDYIIDVHNEEVEEIINNHFETTLTGKTLAELREIATKLGLDKKGNKPNLVLRILDESKRAADRVDFARLIA